jgi:hypothetical protein
VAVLQLDEVNLYSAGTALLEQNLHTLDSLRIFNDRVSELFFGVSKLLTLSSPFSFIAVGLLKIKRNPYLNMNFFMQFVVSIVPY